MVRSVVARHLGGVGCRADASRATQSVLGGSRHHQRIGPHVQFSPSDIAMGLCRSHNSVDVRHCITRSHPPPILRPTCFGLIHNRTRGCRKRLDAVPVQLWLLVALLVPSTCVSPDCGLVHIHTATRDNYSMD